MKIIDKKCIVSYFTLIVSLFLNACFGQVATPIPVKITKVHQDSVGRNVFMLPEFRNSVHDKENQGNQISGVIRTMFHDRNDGMWFGTQDGLFRYDKSGLINFDLKDWDEKSVTVFDLIEDKLGNVWIGYGGGIAKYDGTYFTLYRDKDILPDLWNFYMDSKGLLWVGTLKGVFTFDEKALTAFDLPEGKRDTTLGVSSAKMVHSILEDKTGKMWFGTTGGVCIYDGKTIARITEKDGLSSNFISQVIQRKDGSIWIKAKGGLFAYDGKSLVNLSKKLFNIDNGIGCILEDKKGTFWITVNKREIYTYKDEVLTKIDSQIGDFKLLPFTIYEDRKDRLWFVGLRGAYRYEDNTFVNINRFGPW
jgi:ligand-binding sensor domain-containing protein